MDVVVLEKKYWPTGICVALMLFSYSSGAEDMTSTQSFAKKTVTFEEALRQVISSNHEVMISKEETAIVKSNSTEALLGLMPTVSLKAHHRSAYFREHDQSENAHMGFSSKIPLFDISKYLRLKTKRQELITAKKRQGVKVDSMLHEVGNLYLEALIARMARDNALDEHQQREKQLQVVERKAKLGLMRALDVTRAQYEASKAHGEYLVKSSRFLKLLGDLGASIGVGRLFELSEVRIESIHFKKDKQELLSMAMESNELAMMRNDIAASNYSLAEDRLDFLPKFSASIDGGYDLPYQKHRPNPPASFGLSLMFMVEIPLFEGGKSLTSIRRKSSEYSIKQISLGYKARERSFEINGLLLEMSDLNTAVEIGRLALEAAQKTKESAERLFEKNEATAIELNQASTNLYNAKNDLMSTSLKLEQAKLKLLFAIGKISELL